MIFACSDFMMITCPLKGFITISCHLHSDDPIMEGAEIRCWADDHPIIINELVKKDEKELKTPCFTSVNCDCGADSQ